MIIVPENTKLEDLGLFHGIYNLIYKIILFILLRQAMIQNSKYERQNSIKIRISS